MNRFFSFLLCLLLWLCAVPAAAQDVTLFITSDTHIIAPQLTDMGESFTQMYENGDGKLMRYAQEITQAFAQEVIDAAPQGLIVSGDITFEGARLSHEHAASLFARIEAAGIPVYVLPGNHDLENPVAAQYHEDSYTLVDSVTAEEFAEIYADFGYSEALARDASSLSYSAQLAPGLRLLMIDTNTPAAKNVLTDETLEFIAREILLAQIYGERVITVTHQNLLSHNDLFNAGLMGEPFMFSGADVLLSLLEGTDVIAHLSGHMHIQHIERSEEGFADISTSSLLVYPCQYGVMTLDGSTAQYRTQRVDVSQWAQKKGLDDPDLLHFDSYALAFFSQVCSTADDHLAKDLPDRQWLVDTYEALHAAYFSGQLHTMTSLDRERFSPWLEHAGLFTYMYLSSILEEEFVDHTRITLPY